MQIGGLRLHNFIGVERRERGDDAGNRVLVRRERLRLRHGPLAAAAVEIDRVPGDCLNPDVLELIVRNREYLRGGVRDLARGRLLLVRPPDQPAEHRQKADRDEESLRLHRLPPLPPGAEADPDHRQREHHHAQPEQRAQPLTGEVQALLHGRPRPDGNQVFIRTQPVDHVVEEV